MRQSLRRRGRNRRNLSLLKTQIRKLREAIANRDGSKAKALLGETVSAIDKAVKKGVLHDNAGARHKSRLSLHVNALSAKA
jgi:small subunit ribosomal protein S20